MNKHLYSLDYLRGFAAFVVCLFHFTDKVDYLPNTDPLKVVFGSGHLGVEIFFIISGLVIPYSMAKGDYSFRKIGVFFKKRIIRIEPPYLLCVLLALLLNYATSISPGYKGYAFSIDYEQLAMHVGYLNGYLGKEWINPVFWTLAVEFQYYVLIALFFPLISHQNKWVWMLSLVAFNTLAPLFDRNYIFNFSIFFTTGILIYRYLIGKLNKREALLCFIAVLVVLLYRYSYKEIILVLATGTVIFLPLRPTAVGAFIGSVSYSLYLLHYPIGLRVINLSQKFLHTEFLRQIMVIVALAVSVIAAYYYYKFVEKPFKLKSQQIPYEHSYKRVVVKEVPDTIM
jgi:peptidoglycan/LPS O-acetylase OafA/YrhL